MFSVFVTLLLILLVLDLPRFQFQQQNVGSNREDNFNDSRNF